MLSVRPILVLLAVLGVAGAFVVGTSSARTGAAARIEFFRMPSNNIACAYAPRQGNQPTNLRCDILSGLKPEPRGRCELDWTGVAMGVAGRAGPTCAGDTVFNQRAPVLRYGQTWRRGGITCLSRRTGLRCTNRARHGFFLSRQRWQLF